MYERGERVMDHRGREGVVRDVERGLLRGDGFYVRWDRGGSSWCSARELRPA